MQKTGFFLPEQTSIWVIKRKITDLVEKNQILPQLDSRQFTLSETEKALEFVAKRHTDGKVIIRF